jgi:hypothetical protein
MKSDDSLFQMILRIVMPSRLVRDGSTLRYQFSRSRWVAIRGLLLHLRYCEPIY